MTRGRKRDKFKQWLGISAPKPGEIHHTPNGPQQPDASSSNIRIDNSIHVSGTGHVVTRHDGQGDRNLISQIMSLLSQHIIRGATHDASARDPPPRCHPNTRVNLITRITAWFNGEAQQELLLWITGPAGVGKSAVVQTFAEYLAKSHLLGASVFISRPNRRNKPHGIFVTIAYQLSIRFEAYRNYITERLSIDPELVSGGMAAQFTAFIVEPFVDKKIGAGGKRWGILLDGLDELQGEDAQCQIIQLITAFAHEHRDTPLVWIIASRTEPHISNTFDDAVNGSHWSEYIPVDSNEACEDVDRFLRSSFEAARKRYRQGVPRDWPSESDFLKLTAAASGLFVYAEVVMRFIMDPAEGDPTARLEILLLVVDRSNAVPTKEKPFVHLDALYTEILSLIPPRLWLSTKRLFGYTIYVEQIHREPWDLYGLRRSFETLRGLGLLFGLSPYDISACLLKCHSTIKVPDWKVAHQERLTFFHASFSDFLKNPDRSGDFYVGSVTDIKDKVVSCVFDIWNECSRGTAPAESIWNQYCSLCDDQTPSNAIAQFDARFFQDVVAHLRGVVYHYGQKGDPVLYERLRNIHMIKLCYTFDGQELEDLVENLLNPSSHINNTELVQRVPLITLKFGNLNWEEFSPASARRTVGAGVKWIINRPRSSAELKTFVFELESLQECEPELEVTIFGGTSKGRVAAFRVKLENEGPRSYIIPYPE